MHPTTLTDRELIRHAGRDVHDGLPIEFQVELLERFEHMVYAEDTAVETVETLNNEASELNDEIDYLRAEIEELEAKIYELTNQ